MTEVSIQRVETRYRLPHSLRSEKRRLDQLIRSVVSAACEQAIARLGLTGESELCLRHISAPVSLRLNVPDKALIDCWSAALAEEIACAIRKGSSRRVVVYQSRRQALIDMAQGIARDDLKRRWAWQQLGLWRSSGAATEALAIVELVRALCSQPEMIVPTLKTVAATGELQIIATRLTGPQWQALALAALGDIGASQLLEGTGEAPSAAVMREVSRVVKRSVVFRSIALSLRLVEIGESIRRSLAILAVVDVEPMLLHGKSAAELIDAIANVTRRASLPEELASYKSNDADQFESDVAQNTAERDQSDDRQPLDLRKHAFTRWGGLLFFIPVLEDLNIPEAILDDPVLGMRNFQWVLHQLALNILGLAPNDPAALAFVGLAPEAKPPSSEEEPANESETAALQELVAKIVERLSSLIELEDESQTNLVEFVCYRRAEIVADPGWFEIKFSIDDVSTEIRRAGLDLDPGYVSWLGVVVKFSYE